MKKHCLALALLALALLGCSLSGGGADLAPATEAPAPEPTQTEALAPEPTHVEVPAAPPLTQDQLMDEWRPAYDQGSVLFEVCTLMYQTHSDFGQGVIDRERARAELDTEADFIGFTQRGTASMAAPSEAIAPHLASLEELTLALIEVYGVNDDSIGTPDVLATLDPTCGSLQARMQAIVADAQTAGLSSDSLDTLANEISVEMIEDLYNLTVWGR